MPKAGSLGPPGLLCLSIVGLVALGFVPVAK
jgi:hypothetical protein